MEGNVCVCVFITQNLQAICKLHRGSKGTGALFIAACSHQVSKLKVKKKHNFIRKMILTDWYFLRIILLDYPVYILDLHLSRFRALCDPLELRSQLAEDVLGQQDEGGELAQRIAQRAVRHRLQLLISDARLPALIPQTCPRQILRINYSLHERHLEMSQITSHHLLTHPRDAN